jgi:hydrogenase-4 component F
MLVAVGLLSLAIAVPFIVAQGDLKRLLAYSSIEHLGLCALALGFGGSLALAGLALHLVAHGLTKSSLFLAAGGLVESGRSRRIARLGGSLAANPADGRGFLAGTLLLSGLPPSAMFISEIAIIFGGFQQGWGIAAALAAALLAAAVAGMLFHVVRVAFGSPRRVPLPSGRRPRHLVAVGLPLVITALFGIWAPGPLAEALGRVAQVLGGGTGVGGPGG